MIYFHVLYKAKEKLLKKYTNQLFKLFSVAYLITFYNSFIFMTFATKPQLVHKLFYLL